MQQDFTLDASGTPGRAGNPGKEGVRGGQSGTRGHPGEAGEPGGQIQLRASFRDGQLALHGKLQRGGSGAESVQAEINLSQLAQVRLRAGGGDGGRGGAGGKGAAGESGTPGQDATRYSDGTSGGPGGDGGHGGDAGAGGDGGPGGSVALSLQAEDLDLALLFDWDISAGVPGRAGQPGQGGPGGSGGRGGSSYHWTETETYTDSQGNSQTRTISRSRSGGSRGRDGSSGRMGLGAPDGKWAEVGKFDLWVEDQAYGDRYRLQFVDFQVVSSSQGALLEFGETGNRVQSLQLANAGQAPSPPRHVAVRLETHPGLSPHPIAFPLPSLRAGESWDVPELPFDLAEISDDQLPSLHQRLKRQVRLDPACDFLRLGRRAVEADLPREVEVTFPVALETIPSRTSLLPQQAVMQVWRVHNLSHLPFPPAHRCLEVELRLENGQLETLGSQGEGLQLGPEPTLYRQLDPIAPGEFAEIRLYLRFPESAPTYSQATVSAALKLTPRNDSPAREIQRNPVSFSLAKGSSGKQADVLLVTHADTQPEELQAWLELLDDLGLRWDVWDISWHGDLPLQRLAPRMAGKLVVVLNNPFDSPDRRRLHPTDLMPLKAFREAVARHALSFFFLGSESQIHQQLFPHPESVVEYTSPSQYLKSQGSPDRANPEVPIHMACQLERIHVRRFHLIQNPTRQHLEAEATKLAAALRKKFPEQRFAISLHFEECQDKGLLKMRSYGTLNVRRLPDQDARAVVIRQVYRKTGQRRAFLRSRENLIGLFSAMDFDDKLGLARNLSEGQEFIVEALADAWLLDLSAEQMALRSSGVHLSRARIRKVLNRTEELCNCDFRHSKEPLSVDSPKGQLLTRVAAGLMFLAKSRVQWFDHRIPFLGGTNEIEISEVVYQLVDRMLDLNFGHDTWLGLPKARAAAKKCMDAQNQKLQEEASAVREHSQGKVSPRDAGLEALVRWDLRDYLECDSQLPSGVYSDESLEQLEAKERQAREVYLAMREVYEQASRQAEIPEDAPAEVKAWAGQ